MQFKLLFILLFSILAACGGDAADNAANFQATISDAEMASAIESAQGKSINELTALDRTKAAGHSLFVQHCASCHGLEGKGDRGVPDLSNGVWNWGGSEEDIYTSIAQGRNGVMASFGRTLGEVDIGQVVAYVQSLSDPSKYNNLAEYGEVLYQEHCVVCHGKDGEGIVLGASDLSDDYWQHGGSMMNIRLAVSRGVAGQCPPHTELLNDTELKLLTAHVLNLSKI